MSLCKLRYRYYIIVPDIQVYFYSIARLSYSIIYPIVRMYRMHDADFSEQFGDVTQSSPTGIV